MPATARQNPATLQVVRYDSRRGTLEVVVGEHEARLSREALIRHASEAMRSRSFVCHTRGSEPSDLVDEICFVPRGESCEIVSIHTNGWRRHHGDHRRSLIAILNDIAAAVARGRLHFMTKTETEAELARGRAIVSCTIDDTKSLAAARETVAMALDAHQVDEDVKRTMKLCISEAATNMLVHGGGRGTLQIRSYPGRLRAIIADNGPGLNFLNWIEPPEGAQTSMGYGYKIILDNLAEVYLHTGDEGTTLILDTTV